MKKNGESSNIDITVYGGDFEHFYWNVKDEYSFNLEKLILLNIRVPAPLNNSCF